MAEDDDLATSCRRRERCSGRTACASRRAGRNPDNAHAFIDFILDGRGARRDSRGDPLCRPNAAAMALMPDEDRDNPAIYPAARRARAVRVATSTRARQVETLYEDGADPRAGRLTRRRGGGPAKATHGELARSARGLLDFLLPGACLAAGLLPRAAGPDLAMSFGERAGPAEIVVTGTLANYCRRSSRSISASS